MSLLVRNLEVDVPAGATVGDELQAAWGVSRLSRVLHDLAVLRLRLAVPVDDGPAVDVRIGIGMGDVIATGGTGASAAAQSGSAWWNAREAIEAISESRNGWPDQRWWAMGDDVGPTTMSLLLAIDTVMNGFDAKDRWCALQLVEGRSARELASDLGVTDSTISSRLHGHGIYGWADRRPTPGGPVTGELALAWCGPPADQVVRGVLALTGIRLSRDVGAEDVRTGRWLGRLERSFILVVVVAGQPALTAIPVGGKALFRYAETMADARAGGGAPPRHALVEYVIIGSFASWGQAVLLALIVVGRTAS